MSLTRQARIALLVAPLLWSACAPNGVTATNPGPVSTTAEASISNTSSTRSAAVESAQQETRDASGVLTDGSGSVEASPHVIVVGDSLTVSAREEIDEQLRKLGVEKIEIDAVEGRRLARDLPNKPSGLKVLRERGPFSATDDIVVVALGTNDVGAEASSAEIDDDLDRVLNAVGSEPILVWLDVYIDSKRDESAAFGAELRDRAIERGTMVLGDWYNVAQRPGLLANDGVHLTPKGQDEFASTIADAIDQLTPTPS